MPPSVTHTDPLTLSMPYYKIKWLRYNFIGSLIFFLFLVGTAYFYFTDSPEFAFILMGGAIFGLMSVYPIYKITKNARLYLTHKGISSPTGFPQFMNSMNPDMAISNFKINWSEIVEATLQPSLQFKTRQRPEFIKLTLHTRYDSFIIYPAQWCPALDAKKIKKASFRKVYTTKELESAILLSPLMHYLAKQKIKVKIQPESFVISKSKLRKFALITLSVIFGFILVFNFSHQWILIENILFQSTDSINQAEEATRDYTLPTILANELAQHDAPVLTVAINKQGTYFASGSKDQTLKLWDANTKELIHNFTEHSERVQTAAFSPDGRWLVSGGDGNTLHWWQLKDNKKIATLESPADTPFQKEYSGFYSTNFSPNGDYLAAANWDGNVLIWDTKSRQLRHHISPVQSIPYWKFWADKAVMTQAAGHSDSVNDVAFSPDSKLLASAGFDNLIKIWDVETGGLVNTLEGHDDWVVSVKFSPDGRLLASGSQDRSIHIWDVKTGELLRRLSGHGQSVTSVDFHPDGEVLVSSGQDRAIIYWEVSTGALLEKITGHHDYVNAVEFEPTGQRVISAGADKLIMIWEPTEEGNAWGSDDHSE